MATVLLDAFGDIDLSTGKVVVTTAPATEYKQKMNARLNSFKGEWRYDTGRGVPWFERIFVKNPKLALVQEILRKTILSVPGTTGLTFTQLTFDKVNRKLTVGFRTTTDFQSTPISFDQTFSLFKDVT